MFKVQQYNSFLEEWKDAIIIESRKGWDNCSFSKIRDAEIYAYLWCHAVTKDEASILCPTFGMSEISFASDASFREPVKMRIVWSGVQ